MTEADLKRAVLMIAYAAGWKVFHVPATTVRGSQGRGYPDLTLARGGHVLWFELKQATGKLTEEQLRWGDQLPPGQWYCIRPADIGLVQDLLS